MADDDQIIYQWNGADYRRLDQFRTDFKAALLQIPTNFRCPPEVVECANNLIASNLLRSGQKKPLVAGRDLSGGSSAIEVLAFQSDSEEAQGIAQHIADHRANQLQQTVVLGRVRTLLDPIAEELKAIGIESQIVVRRDEFQSPGFRWMHNALRLAVHNTDERVLRALTGTYNEMFGCSLSTDEIIAHAEVDRVDLLTSWHRTVQASVKASDALVLANAAVEHHRGDSDHAKFSAVVCGVFDVWLARERGSGGEARQSSALEEDRAAWHALSTEVGRAIGIPTDAEQFLQELWSGKII